ncbi:MAG: hypothetical protein ABJG78_07515 [Cyclobacteriaceae bacterium]
MRIAVYLCEPNHYSFLNQILIGVPKSWEVDLYTSAFYRDNNQFAHGVNFKDDSLFSLLRRAKTYDSIVIDELMDKRMFLLVFFAFHAPKVNLVIHNLVSWFQPSYDTSIRNIMVSVYRKIVSKHFRNYIVVGTQLKEWAEKTAPGRHFKFIPFGLNSRGKFGKSVTSMASIRKLNVVVPGMVSKRRKYENIIKLISEKDFVEKVHFTLLGRPSDDYGEAIVAQLEHKKNVTTFNSFISVEEFQERVKNCDFILSDFDEFFVTRFGQDEIYGLTKETGISFLMLAYCKPGIVPTHYKGMKEMQSQMLHFEDYQSLKRILLRIVSEETVRTNLEKEAFLNLKSIKMSVDSILN